MRIGAILFTLCMAAASCSDSAPLAPTLPSPTPVIPPEALSFPGRWEGSYLYDRTEPSGCPTIGIFGSGCPTVPVPMILTLTQDGDTVTGSLETRIYGDGGI